MERLPGDHSDLERAQDDTPIILPGDHSDLERVQNDTLVEPQLSYRDGPIRSRVDEVRRKIKTSGHESELWSVITELIDLVSVSFDIDSKTRNDLVKALRKTKTAVSSGKFKRRQRKKWTRLLTDQVQAIKKSGLTESSVHWLRMELEQIQNQAYERAGK